jgi:hypothetical protein
MRSRSVVSLRSRIFAALFILPLVVVPLTFAPTAGATVAWSIRAIAEPTQFSPNSAVKCEKEAIECERYELLPMNIGNSEANEPITVTDKLPPGLTTAQAPESKGEVWVCPGVGAGSTEVTCTYNEGPINRGAPAPPIIVYVTSPLSSQDGESLKNEVSITGGGTSAVTSSSEETLVSSSPPQFGLSEFSRWPPMAGHC